MKKRFYFPVLATLGLIVFGCEDSLSDSDSPDVKATVLVQGSPIHGGSNGIYFDSDNQLYIASIVSRKIYRVDRETGEILKTFGTEQGVEGPDDLIVGPDGSIYWTSVFTGEIGRLSPEGIKTGQFLPPFVNPITFSDDGRLFVALDFFDSGLYELDPNLVAPPRLIDKNLPLNGMAFGPDGLLYAPYIAKGQIVSVDVEQGTTTVIAEGFQVPATVKFDSQGRMYSGDVPTGEIFRIDRQTGSKEVIGQTTFGIDNLAFDSDDRLFVSNSHDGSIVEILSNGSTRTVVPAGMIAPGGVSVQPRADGVSVFVADVFSLIEFDGQTGEERSVERDDLLPGGLTSPMTISPDGDNFVLSSWLFSIVQVWNPKTREVLEEYKDFAVPLNAIRFQNDLVVIELGADHKKPRVILVNATERITLADATHGLEMPIGLAAKDGNLWLSEWASGKVLQIVSDGVPLSAPIEVATELSFPEGIAVEPDGKLLVVETGAGRLSRIAPKTGKVSTVVEGLELGGEAIPNTPSTYIFNDVAVDPSGVIYVTGDVANVLYRIK